MKYTLKFDTRKKELKEKLAEFFQSRKIEIFSTSCQMERHIVSKEPWFLYEIEASSLSVEEIKEILDFSNGLVAFDGNLVFYSCKQG